MSKLLSFLLLLFGFAYAQAQTLTANHAAQPIADQLNDYLASAVAAYKFNGVALVAKKGEVLLHKAYGWRNVAAQAPNDTSTRFPILSITKSFTAMVLLKLQEQNKLSLNDKLSKYFPDFPNGDKITVEQLISHTSGIYNYTDDIGEEDSALVNHPISRQLFLDIVYNKPPNFSPGKGFAYNNSGYYLAGLVVEKATGKSYEQNVRELIFDPLGMSRSGFAFNGLPEAEKATGYQFLTDQQQKPYTYLDSTVGYSAGAIYSTTGDLYNWTQAIAQQQLLSPASWKQALTRKAGDYGLGFRLNNFFGRDYIKHSGGYPGFVSEFVYYPKQEVTIILLKNSGTYGEDVWPVTMGISSIVFGLPYDRWTRRTEIKLPLDQLQPKVGTYAVGKLKIAFVVKENRLYEVLPGGQELLLLAESEDSFYLENFNTHIRFEKDSKGVYEKVVIHEHGKDYELKKTK
jgi:CubicO group peptidase (beta-lactamase class C family)